MKQELIFKPLSPSMSLQGRMKCIVIDAKTKKAIREYPWQKNLILNYGLDRQFTVAGSTFFGLPRVLDTACVGNGTTPTQDDSGATTATQVGTEVTLSGGSFVFTDTGTDAGKVIKWDSGEESTVVTVVSATEVTVLESQSVIAGEFTVYRTNQTILANETVRTSTKVAGANGTDILAPHQYEFYRTYEFVEEVADVTYTEAGFRELTTLNSPLTVRVLLATPVSLLAGQQLRLVHRMRCTVSPATKLINVDDLIAGWPQYPVTSQECEWGIESLAVQVVTSNGISDELTGGQERLEPRQIRLNGQLDLHKSTADVESTPIVTSKNLGQANRIGATITAKTTPVYVPNSFDLTTTFTVTPAWGYSDEISSIFLSYAPLYPQLFSYMRIRFYVPQTKLDTYRLRIPIRYGYTRVLS